MVNNYSVSLTSRFSAIDAHVLRYRDLAVRDGSCRLRVIGHRLCADILLHHATSLVSELNRFRIIKLIIIFHRMCLFNYMGYNGFKFLLFGKEMALQLAVIPTLFLSLLVFPV